MKKKTKITIGIVALIAIIIIVIAVMLMFKKGDTQETMAKAMTAEEIANELKSNISTLGEIVVYTEETDLNNLLGRPNQYTSKVTFEDTRLEQTNKTNEFLTEEQQSEPIGGTIEVFNNEEDMQNRKNYIESISSSMSMLSQYIYAKGNVLLRLDNELTPSQASEYENAFNEIIK